MSNSTTDKLQQAFACFNAQNLVGTEQFCREILGGEPGHAGALHLLGMVRLMSDKPREAVALIGRALEATPRDTAVIENLGLAHLASTDFKQAEALFRQAIEQGAAHGMVYMRLGLALGSQGRLAEAEVALRTATERAPDDPDTHLNLGNALTALGRPEDGLACYRKAVALQPRHADAQYNLGMLLNNMGRHAEALAAFHHLLTLAPEHPDVHNSLGLVHAQLGQRDEAVRCFRKALAIAPNYFHAHSNLGNVLRELVQLDEAAASCERALAIRPDFADALVNLGSIRVEQMRVGEAQALYERALQADPRSADAHRNLGLLFRTQGRMKEALVSYRKALESAPGQAVVHAELASTLRDNGEFDAALAAYRSALELDPRSAATLYNLAETFKVMGRFDEAIAAYERTLEQKPDYYRALGGLAYLRQHVCDWNAIESMWERLRTEAVGKPDSALSPFSVLYMPFSAQEQLACAKEWARLALDRLAAARAALGFGDPARAPHPRLRIGYLSWDFHQHATSYLMAELFELHDRDRFEIFAYSFGPDDGSPIRARIRGASEHFVDISGESYSETARRIRGDGIDVLVDLKGYTMGSRPQILALRPAPVQVSWLGFPGSLGTACVDYIIADPFIIPEGAERHYSERVVRLPDCYQVNDRKREIAATTPTREECGLPATGFIFCSFNQTAKILPDVFAAWMRIMKAVPGSVLWLLETNRWAMDNLRRAAGAQGVAGERLVFARPRPLPEHLARYRLAGLCLDTYPYGSHTTASDALWAGCPLVSRAGETFASRVAGSILINAGMRELVTDSLEAYERLVNELASSPARLQDVRRRLREGRDSWPLFDTPRFVRNLERAYHSMVEAHGNGLRRE